MKSATTMFNCSNKNTKWVEERKVSSRLRGAKESENLAVESLWLKGTMKSMRVIPINQQTININLKLNSWVKRRFNRCLKWVRKMKTIWSIRFLRLIKIYPKDWGIENLFEKR
jgi:hypothetical protein